MIVGPYTLVIVDHLVMSSGLVITERFPDFSTATSCPLQNPGEPLYCIMSFVRTAAITTRGVSGLRAFSTARVFRAELAYQVYGPEKEQATRDPILFLHGLFGSKQNNRSISKYAIAMSRHRRFESNFFSEL
jgi:hypothetical protein